MKFLLDTDHISIIQRESGAEFVELSRRIANHPLGEVCMSIVSFHEQVLGCNSYISQARNRAEILRGYAMFEGVLLSFSDATVLPFDSIASDWFDRLTAQRLRVATMDLRIASIALSRGLILLTRNVSDFAKMPGLSTEDWTR